MRSIVLLVLLSLFASTISYSQCPATGFDVPANACREQILSPVNTSDAGEYQWDFCTGEFNGVPSASFAFTVAGATGRPAIELVQDNGTWFGFVTGTFSNSLHRLEFGNGIDNDPTQITNIGDLNGALNNPGELRIIREGGEWHGILHNAGTGQLLKLDFSDGITGPVTASVLATDVGTINGGIALAKDALHGWVCIASNVDNGFTILRLGNELQQPGAGDIISTPTVPNANNLGDVDLINDCGNWYGMAANFGGGNVYRLTFGQELFSVPTVDQLASLPVSNNGRLRLVKDGEDFFLFVASLDGVFNKLTFGSDIESTPTIVDEGTIGDVLQANTYGLALAVQDSEWTIFNVSQSDGKVYRIHYDNNCSAFPQTSDEPSPSVSYESSGAYNISLHTKAGDFSSSLTKQVVISALRSPDISFTSENICVNHDVNFLSTNNSGDINSYSWDFGDMSVGSTTDNPVHKFLDDGDYLVSLDVVADNGCTNRTSTNITIYPEPVADFDTPDGLLCTNDELLIQNNTADVFEGNLRYEWFVNTKSVSTDKDLVYTFQETGPQTITLVASIDGCSDEVEATTPAFQAGPSIDFLAVGQCESEVVSFTSQIAEPVTGHSWNFGDGATASEVDVEHTFALPGIYAVSLSATSANGCTNTAAKEMQIFSKPAPDFDIIPPPQSCSGTPSPFIDLTPDPSDSDIAEWFWDFGAAGESGVPNPSPTFDDGGAYPVALTVTTDQGCSASIEKEVNIQESPHVEIESSPSCLDMPAMFTANGDDIQSYYWEIGTAYYETADVEHIFHTTGPHTVTLLAQGNNNCYSNYERDVTVPIPLSPAFSVEKNCVGVEATFVDLTEENEAIQSRTWDFDGEVTADGLTAEHTFDSPGEKLIALTITTVSGCEYEAAATIEVVPPPEASFSAYPTAGGAPLTVIFYGTTPGVEHWEWDLGDGTQATLSTVIHTYETVGKYVAAVVVENSQGCSSSTSQEIDVQVPAPDVRINTVTTVQNPDGTTKVIVTIENAGNTVFEQLPIEIDISGETLLREVFDEPTGPGQVRNFVSDFGIVGNPRFVCVKTILPADVNIDNDRFCIEFSDEVQLLEPFPNPVSQTLNVEWISNEEGHTEVDLLDVFGRTINHSSINSKGGLNTLAIDVQSHQSGLYFLVVRTGSTTHTRRIFIAREN